MLQAEDLDPPIGKDHKIRGCKGADTQPSRVKIPKKLKETPEQSEQRLPILAAQIGQRPAFRQLKDEVAIRPGFSFVYRTGNGVTLKLQLQRNLSPESRHTLGGRRGNEFDENVTGKGILAGANEEAVPRTADPFLDRVTGERNAR
jgi:hypothetical protein